MKLKRFLSTFLSIAMIMTMLPITSQAKFAPGQTEKAKIKMVLMQEDPDAASGPKFKQVSTDEITKTQDSEFYVGIVTEDFNHLEEVVNYEKDQDYDEAVSAGLNGLMVSLSYNSDILKVEPDYWRVRNDTEEFRASNAMNALVSRMDYTGSISNITSDGTKVYTMYDTTNLSPKTADIPVEDAADGLDTRLGFTIENGNITSFSAPYSGEGPDYLAIVKFKFVSDGTNIDPGTRVVGLAHPNYEKTSNSLNTLKFGSSLNSDGMVYQDDRQKSTSGSSQDIREFVDFVEEPLYPDVYTITYDANGAVYDTPTVAGWKDGVIHGNDATGTRQDVENLPEGPDAKATLKNENDETISTLLEPPTGKVFQGWSTDQDTYSDATKFIAGTAVTGDITVYAHYTNGYAVNFDLNTIDTTAQFNDGKTGRTRSIEKPMAGTVGEPTIDTTKSETLAGFIGPDPTRTNYTFEGWYTKKADGSFDTKYTETDLQSNTAALDLYAMWKETSDYNADYTIHFDENAPVDKISKHVTPTEVGFKANDTLGSTIGGLPVSPERNDNYKFMGWYMNKSGDGAKLADDTVLDTLLTADNTDVTVYARWDYVDDPTVSPIPAPFTDTITVKFDKTGGTYNGGTYNAGEGTIADKYVDYGQSIGYMPGDTQGEMTLQNKVFEGWHTTEQSAKDANDKKVTATTSINNQLDASLSDTTGGTLTLYAWWTDKVTVSYDLNGFGGPGTSVQAPQSVTDFPGQPLTIESALTANKYLFTGWNTAANGTGTAYAADAVTTFPGNDITLYAMYDYTGGDAVTVIFNGNGVQQVEPTLKPSDATDTTKYTIVRQPGTKLTKAQMPIATTAKAYTFNHWNKNAFAQLVTTTEADGSITQPDIELPAAPADGSAQTMNVYGIWETTDPNKRAVIFHPNNADSDPSADTTIYVADGDTLNMTPSYTDPNGKVLQGWWKNSNVPATYDGTNTDAFTVPAVISGGDMNVYGVWASKVKVTYDLNGLPAATTPPSVEKIPGESFTVENAPSITDPTKYTFTGWSTTANGSTGTTTYAAGVTNTIPSQNTTLYAIYDYIGADAVEVTYHGNGAQVTNPTLSPAENGDPTTYIKRYAPGTTLTKAQMPTATSASYTFNHWNENAFEAALTPDGDGNIAQPLVTLPASTGALQKKDLYGIWTVTDPNDDRTVTFKPNNTDTTPAGDTVVHVANGGTVNMLPKYTKQGEVLQGWWKSQPAEGLEYDANDPQAFTTSTPVTGTMTVYGVWADNVTVTYHLNNGTPTSSSGPTSQVTLTSGQTLTEAGKTLPTVEREHYTSAGWKYTDASGAIHNFDANTVIDSTNTINGNIDVYAAWDARIRVDFKDATQDEEGNLQIKYTYDGTAQTPMKDNNFDVILVDNNQDAGTLSGFTTADFTAKYKIFVQGDNTPPTDTTTPKDANTYTIALERNTANTNSTLDPYTTYTVVAHPNQYTIEAATINYIISNNYQYISSSTAVSEITDIGIAVDGTAPTPGPDITISNVLNGDAVTADPRTADINVVFTNVKDSSKVFTNIMPNECGEYDISVTASKNSNFKVGTIKDADNVDPAKLYIISLSRQIDVNYGDGLVKENGTVQQNNHVKTNYATVKIPEPTPKTAVQNAKTTLSNQEAPVPSMLPAEGTDFVAPQGKRIKRFYTLVFNDDGTPKMTDGVNQDTADFDAITPISSDSSPLTIYAEYENAEWTVTFHDTKSASATPAPENDKKYTIAAEKAIEDTEADGSPAVQKVEEIVSGTATDITGNITDLSVLPEPSAAPANMTFGGWTTDSSVAAMTNLKMEDVSAGGQHASKMFTKANKPGDALLTDNGDPISDVTVYAVYVLSSDATLSGVEFRETDNAGNVIPFRDSNYNLPGPTATPIPFDKDTTTYYLVVNNDIENVFEKFTPSQSGSTVTITWKDTSSAAAATPVPVNTDTTTGAVDGTPAVNVTKYDSENDINSVNVFEVKVTAPDRTETTYTFNVLRYAKARFVLKPGNSPYGLIEAMRYANVNPWDDARIAAAKTDFNTLSASAEANRFKSTAVNGQNDYYIPTNANKDLVYYLGAWEDSVDPVKNMDRNIYSIFAYNGESFDDTGFTAYDSFDRPVNATNVTRTLTVKRMPDASISSMKTTLLTDLSLTKTGEADTYTFTDFVGQDASGMKYICPGKYEMRYSFIDPVTGQTIENARDDSAITDADEKAAENLKRRYIVYVWTLGDANMSTAVDVGDRGTINEILASVTKFDDISSETEALYKFRIADANNSSAVDVGDRGTINEFLASMTKRPFYK